MRTMVMRHVQNTQPIPIWFRLAAAHLLYPAVQCQDVEPLKPFAFAQRNGSHGTSGRKGSNTNAAIGSRLPPGQQSYRLARSRANLHTGLSLGVLSYI